MTLEEINAKMQVCELKAKEFRDKWLDAREEYDKLKTLKQEVCTHKNIKAEAMTKMGGDGYLTLREVYYILETCDECGYKREVDQKKHTKHHKKLLDDFYNEIRRNRGW